jgi:hypothetical protein
MSASLSDQSREDNIERRVERIEMIVGLRRRRSPSHDGSETGENPSTTDLDGYRYQLLIGPYGQTTYHGPTSLLHHETSVDIDSSNVDRPSTSGENASPPSVPYALQHGAVLKAYERLTRVSFPLLSVEAGMALLDAFFCWSGPLYNVVQAPVFIRELVRCISALHLKAMSKQDTWLSMVLSIPTFS